MIRVRSIELALALAASLAATGEAAWAQAPELEKPAKPRLLVRDFVAEGTEPGTAAGLSVDACQAFSRIDGYDVVCAEEVRNLARYGQVSAALAGCAEDRCAAPLGKAAKARFVVSGTVRRRGRRVLLSLSMLDTRTGRVAGKGSAEADSAEQLRLKVPEAVAAVLRR